MEALRIIKKFGNLLTDNPSIFAEAWQDLPELDKNLGKLPNNQPLPIAEAILDWCEKYPHLQEALRRHRYELGDEEIDTSDKISDEMMIKNITLVRNIIKTSQQKPSPQPKND